MSTTGRASIAPGAEGAEGAPGAEDGGPGDAAGASAFGAYAPRPGAFDEMAEGPGRLRPHWRDLAAHLSAQPPGTMARRWERGRRMLDEHGATYQMRAEPPGGGVGGAGVGGPRAARPWELDPMPMVLPPGEWAEISAGLAQRAELLDAVLGDLYGPRRLLAEGLLPPDLVLGHPEYLRACRGIAPAGGRHLSIYAADLARGPDGRWTVVADRCEAPAGLGYALENRHVAARILPEELRAGRVEPLQPFVQHMVEALGAMSPRRFETPRIVLLTPGPRNDTYFEHVYLARQLGCTLVESEDLAVRDGRLFLKTLDGLKPVDVALRFTRGAMCDPIELRSDSFLGVAGLAQAARNGSVALANALGSGVIEAPALSAFLPAISAALLGEPLALPSPPTLWCGEGGAREEALSRMDRLVFRSAVDVRAAGVYGDALSAAGREDLAARVRARPGLFAAQAPVVPSTAPVWRDGRVEPRPMVLRVFLVARNGGYEAMPGGLTRVSEERSLPTLALQGGEGGSKDVWVRAEGAPAASLGPAATAPVVLSRGGRDLPSRVADNLFWFGRYVERCENTTRMLRVAFAEAEEAVSSGDRRASALPTLLPALGPGPAFAGREGPSATAGGAAEAAAALGRLHFQDGPFQGLRASADRLHRTAAAVRDRLSNDTWRTVQRLSHRVAALTPDLASDPGEAQGRLDDVLLALESASGLAMENMTRGLGWRFLDIGRRIERAGHVVDLLASLATVPPAETRAALDALLAVLDSVMTYRARYLSAPRPAPVIDLLLCDESNPRSVGFQFAVLSEHMDRLVEGHDAARIRPEQRLMVFLAGSVRMAEVDQLAAPGEDGRRYELARLLEVLRSKVWELSEVVTNEYFTHAGRRATPWRLGAGPGT